MVSASEFFFENERATSALPFACGIGVSLLGTRQLVTDYWLLSKPVILSSGRITA